MAYRQRIVRSSFRSDRKDVEAMCGKILKVDIFAWQQAIQRLDS
jgi:hypothetical protein